MLFMVLDEIRTILVNAGVTVPVTIGKLPKNIDTVVSISQYYGREPNYINKKIEEPNIQIRIRTSNATGGYQQGVALIALIRKTLHHMRPTGNFVGVYHKSTSDILNIDTDERNNWSMNFRVTYQNPN